MIAIEHKFLWNQGSKWYAMALSKWIIMPAQIKKRVESQSIRGGSRTYLQRTQTHVGPRNYGHPCNNSIAQSLWRTQGSNSRRPNFHWVSCRLELPSHESVSMGHRPSVWNFILIFKMPCSLLVCIQPMFTFLKYFLTRLENTLFSNVVLLGANIRENICFHFIPLTGILNICNLREKNYNSHAGLLSNVKKE